MTEHPIPKGVGPETLREIVAGWGAVGADEEPRNTADVAEATGISDAVGRQTRFLEAIGVLEREGQRHGLTDEGAALADAIADGDADRARAVARDVLERWVVTQAVVDALRGNPVERDRLRRLLAALTEQRLDDSRASSGIGTLIDLYDWAGVLARDDADRYRLPEDAAGVATRVAELELEIDAVRDELHGAIEALRDAVEERPPPPASSANAETPRPPEPNAAEEPATGEGTEDGAAADAAAAAGAEDATPDGATVDGAEAGEDAEADEATADGVAAGAPEAGGDAGEDAEADEAADRAAEDATAAEQAADAGPAAADAGAAAGEAAEGAGGALEAAGVEVRTDDGGVVLQPGEARVTVALPDGPRIAIGGGDGGRAAGNGDVGTEAAATSDAAGPAAETGSTGAGTEEPGGADAGAAAEGVGEPVETVDGGAGTGVAGAEASAVEDELEEGGEGAESAGEPQPEAVPGETAVEETSPATAAEKPPEETPAQETSPETAAEGPPEGTAGKGDAGTGSTAPDATAAEGTDGEVSGGAAAPTEENDEDEKEGEHVASSGGETAGPSTGRPGEDAVAVSLDLALDANTEEFEGLVRSLRRVLVDELLAADGDG